MAVNGPSSVGAAAFRELCPNWVSGSVAAGGAPVVIIPSPGPGKRIVIISYMVCAGQTGTFDFASMPPVGSPVVLISCTVPAGLPLNTELDDRGLVAGDGDSSITLANTLTPAGPGLTFRLTYLIEPTEAGASPT